MSQEKKVLTPGQIPTVRQLYEKDGLQKPQQSQEGVKPNAKLLDKVAFYRGDITGLGVDAIVNAANKGLLGGGGVDGAIHHAAGPKLLDECRTLNGCDTGDAKLTRGYNLPARFIIHTVGPVYCDATRDFRAEQLASCYTKSLDVAVEHKLKTIAFPCISTGVYGYPHKDAATIALTQVRKYLESEKGEQIDCVVFVVFLGQDEEIYRELIPQIFPNVEDNEGEKA